MTNLSDVFASADQVAIGILLVYKAMEWCQMHKLEDSWEYVYQKLAEILVASKASMMSGGV